jgi:hypothetical protein
MLTLGIGVSQCGISVSVSVVVMFVEVSCFVLFILLSCLSIVLTVVVRVGLHKKSTQILEPSFTVAVMVVAVADAASRCRCTAQCTILAHLDNTVLIDTSAVDINVLRSVINICGWD